VCRNINHTEVEVEVEVDEYEKCVDRLAGITVLQERQLFISNP
jgi:hypothetical protein